jgi:hypothetical protein
MKKTVQFKALYFTGVFLSAIFLLTSCGSSRRTVGIEEGWELLSERKVNFVRDKDEIEIKSRHMFTAIRFAVEDREVQINELKIFFQNGDKLEPALNETINAGQSSRIIDIALEGRYIDKIEFRYRTTGNVLKGRANVLVFGKRYNPGY